MGLDSVDLLVGWEKYFDIQIPDKEAEVLRTVQDVVDCISQHLNISKENSNIKEEVFEKLKVVIIERGYASKLNYSDLLNEIIPTNSKETWNDLSKRIGLEIPVPTSGHKDSPMKRFVSKLIWIPKYNYRTLTFNELTDIIVGANYQKLIDQSNIRSKYEVYIVLMGITVDKIGIDFYEFAPNKTFVNDFGID